MYSPQHVSISQASAIALRLRPGRFYRDALGYEEAFDTRKVEGGLVTVAFFKVNDTQFIELFPGLKPEEAQPMTHVAFQTSDIEKLHKITPGKQFFLQPEGNSCFSGP